MFTLLVVIVYAAHVDGPHAMFLEPVDGLFQIALLEVPIAGKVVDDTIGNDAQRNSVTHLFLFMHQAVYGIVQCRVTACHHDGFVAVMYQHGHQSFHAVQRLALHKVVQHLALVQHALKLLALLRFPSPWAIQDAPPIIHAAKVIQLFQFAKCLKEKICLGPS